MKIEENKLTADIGKVLRRISDGQITGSEIVLGYTYYLHGEALGEPLLELPEHYEEIDEPVTDETIILDEQTPLVEELPDAEPEETVQTPQKVTLADYRELEETVRKLKEKLGI